MQALDFGGHLTVGNAGSAQCLDAVRNSWPVVLHGKLLLGFAIPSNGCALLPLE